jgi:hypothetical protein
MGIPSRRLKSCVWVSSCVLLISWFCTLRHDDAYITYRYGQNLAQGLGFYFNPGDPVMGSTAPGHVLISAFVYRLFGQHLTLFVLSALGCVGWTAQAIAVDILLQRALPRVDAFFVSLCVLMGAGWAHRYVALETNIVAALVLWTLVTAAGHRWIVAAVLGGIALLVRPDAALVLIVLTPSSLKELRLGAWKPALVAALPGLAWALFAWLRFGSVIPHSAQAKIGHSTMGQYAWDGFRFVTINLFSPHIWFTDYGVDLPRLWVRSGSLSVFLLALFGSIVLSLRSRVFFRFACFGALYFLAYTFLRASPGMDWHLYPVSLVVAVSAISGCILIVRTISTLLEASRHPTWGFAVGVAARVGFLAFFAGRTFLYSTIQERAYWYGARDEVFQQVSRYLLRNGSPTDVVMTGEPGTLAYFTRLRVWDEGGLVSAIENQGERPVPQWLLVLPYEGRSEDAARDRCLARFPGRACSARTFAQPFDDRELSWPSARSEKQFRVTLLDVR